MSCPDMQNGPLYVELKNHAAGSGPQRWLVAATFGGRQSEQLVTTNLGAAFFADFKGGRVGLTATLQECASPPSDCHGELDLTINARR